MFEGLKKKKERFTFAAFSEILADLKRPSMQYFKNAVGLFGITIIKANLGKIGAEVMSILCFRKTEDFIFNIDQIKFHIILTP